MRSCYCVLGNLIHIIRCCIMFLIVETVRINKVSVLTAKLLCLLIHQLDKCRNIAVADIIGKHKCGVIARRHHHTVEKLKHADFFIDIFRKTRNRAVCSIKLVKNALLDCYHCIFKVLNLFGNDYVCHNLCC